jgi:hypothetical protein
VILSLDVDYYAHIWLNGELVLLSMDLIQGPPFSFTLRLGINSLICKVGAGSDGFSVQLKIAELTSTRNGPDRLATPSVR